MSAKTRGAAGAIGVPGRGAPGIDTMQADEARDIAAPANMPLAGISLFLSALFLAALHVGMSKILAADLPVLLVVWGRYIVYLLLVLPVAISLHGRAAFFPPKPGLQTVRGLLIAVSTLMFILAVSGAPVAETTAIIFVYPFIMMAFAPLVLGERNSGSGWLAIGAGFAGVLIVMRPGFGAVGWYGLFAFAAGVTIGTHFLITRRIGSSVPPLITAAFTAIIGTIVLSLTLPWIWQPLTLPQMALMVGIGIAATFSQIFMIMACNRADMATLAPFSFIEILFATMVGFTFFAEFPDAVAWLGIVVVAGSGLYIASIQSGRRLPILRRLR